MSIAMTSGREASFEVLGTLENVCQRTEIDTLGRKLAELRGWLAGDLAEIDRALAEEGARGTTVAEKCARHLLDQDGKRLRPICVALASRVGEGFNEAARRYAIAVELVHSATLLHDDVVDLGERRRGADAARVIYGNAASIFGGDWLLLEALSTIEGAGQGDVLSRMLAVIKEMVLAECVQLERRGQARTTASEYFRIVEGKTASLFRWAMFAGGRAGGVPKVTCEALESYGQKLGVAFQIVDDVLDLSADAVQTGKTVLGDLREGKMTYPLILAMERSPGLRDAIEAISHAKEAPIDASLFAEVVATLERTRAIDASLEVATRLCKEAAAELEAVPEGRARAALESVAIATARRRR